MNDIYELRDVGMQYDGTVVLRDATLDFPLSQMVTIVGPNGAGKSTLLGIMAGLREHYKGCCLLDGKEVRRWSRGDFARKVSFVPQSLRLEFPFTSEQVVLMGRTPYCDGLFESPEDHAAVEQALVTTDTLAFRSRDFRSLSGGERQRVVLASALAQEPTVLLLDEPTTFLDLRHQIELYRLLHGLCRRGLLVIAVTHDLNLASAYSDRVVVLHNGRVVADDAPAKVLVRDRIQEVFGVDTEVREGPEGKPWIVYGD